MSEMSREETISMLEQIGRHECIWMVCRHNEVYETIDNAIKALKEQRPHGEWEKKPEICYDYFYCSECGYAYKHAFNFCPNCGSDNRKKGDENA